MRRNTRTPVLFLALLSAASSWAQASVQIMPEMPLPELGAVYIEGEDAIATNFSREPEIRFGASGLRVLRLQRKTAPYGGMAWYAEYAFVIEEGAEYELWYAGSPPASRQPDAPGYYGPVDVSIDGSAYARLAREDGPALAADDSFRRWIRIRRLRLEPGTHTVRVEIREKRSADGAYAFEIDRLAAVRVMDGRPSLPRGASEDPESERALLAASEYERRLKLDQRDAAAHRALVEIAFALGDYTAAVRYAQRATLALPDDPRFLKALARARIGIDDVPSGLTAWERYLSLRPDDLAGWQEAAKTAAWRSEYARSIALYRMALAVFPDDATLAVDYGLALLWSGQGTQGEQALRNAERAALKDPARATDLARAFSASGYPERGSRLLSEAVKAYPSRAELRFALADSLERSGDPAGADRVLAAARAAYVPEDRFLAFAAREEARILLARDTIALLAARSAASPDDLAARELYVQALFWNGRRKEAIAAYAALIVGKAYEALVAADSRDPSLDLALDRAAALRIWAYGLPASVSSRKKALADAAAAVDQADRALAAFQAKAAKDEAAGKPAETAGGQHLLDALGAAQAALGQALADESARASLDAARAAELESLAAETEARAAEDAPLAARFAAENEASGWYLDRQLWTRDAREAARSGDILAWYVALRFPGGNLTRAEETQAWRAVSSSSVPAIAYAAFGRYLRQGDIPAALSLAAGPASAYRPSLSATAERLLAVVPPPGSETQSFADAAQAVSGLDALAARAASFQKAADLAVSRVSALKRSADERVLRDVERDTVALRRELGSFYVADGQGERAAEQFRNAVKNDRGDTAATFELANMRQRSGDWREAMELYRVVYGYDPSYANVQGFHNALARTYADRLDAVASGYADSSIAVYEAKTGYTLGLSSTLTLGAGLSSRELKRYVASSYLIDDGMGGTTAVDEDPSFQSLRDIRLTLGFSPLGRAFSVETELGATLFDPRATAGFSPSGADITAALAGLRPYPRAAIRTRFGSRGVSAQLDLGARLMDESLVPGRPTMYRGSAEASLTLPFLDFSYARTYGRVDAVLVDGRFDDLRYLATGLQELALGIHLDDAPWTNLMLSAEASLEHAFAREPWLYYAPDMVVNARGAVAYMTWLGLSRGNVLGLSARAAGGLYAEAGLAYPIVQAEARAEWTRRDATLALRAWGTQTFPSSKPPYWALGFELTGSVAVPDLIAP